MRTILPVSSQSRPLAACTAALFGLTAPPAMAILPGTVYVDTCDEAVSNTDPTHGSLRWALANVDDPGMIDMTDLKCGTISLQTGELTVTQNDLTIVGPGMPYLSIRAKYSGVLSETRVFNHTGTGQLSISELAISFGYYKKSTGFADGGCIYSSGDLYLMDVAVYGCKALTDSGTARGGAVAAATVTLDHSIVSGNTAHGGASGASRGGGVFTGPFASTASAIKYNGATGDPGTYLGFGGGLNVSGGAVLVDSTVSSNTATKCCGGIDSFEIPQPVALTLWESTVSGNSAGIYAGGLWTDAANVYLYNATVAFNTATTNTGYYGNYSPGVATSAYFGPQYISLRSSVLSNNVYGSFENDLNNVAGSYYATFNPGPAYNLVRASGIANCLVVLATTDSPAVVPAACLPYDTIRLACPHLESLRDNGGPTKTHALLSGSVAIDNGDPFKFSFDQRGSPYVRESGSQADIGAYEVQQGDIVFNTDFEGCPLLL